MSLAATANLGPAVLGDPRREIRYGLAVGGLFFIGFLGWAAVAPLDAAAFAGGTVTTSGGPQAIQSREGGVVQALHVREGDLVAKGDVLLDLAAADVRENARALNARVVARRAEIARLEAERSGATELKPWLGFDLLTGEDGEQARQALALEQATLRSRLAAARTEQAVLAQRVVQGRQQMTGAERELAALRTQDEVLGRQLDAMRSLADKGYAPRIKVNDLEQTAAGLKGAMGSRQADVARLSSAVGEAQLQISEYGLRREREIAEGLRMAQDDLRALEPQLAAARELLRRAEVKAPAAGRIFALQVNAPGAVARPGETILRLVPTEQDLVVSAKLPARDAADVRVGQSARVKFPALHDRGLPRLDGRIEKVSADSYIDERTGAQFFEIEVKVDKAKLAALQRARGVEEGIRPGLAAEVMITLRKRTALQYALEPLAQGFGRSGREP
ncbi:MAG: HlyD family type I secretion periplasmic adaptor subunit [Phenylobacterium sp.]|uniref:HlyD family type I secretion periplasmic adaptor subunit n=1 Tax=Phenylobacterium sp. TaxID=1871053 RepID=UPI003919475D